MDEQPYLFVSDTLEYSYRFESVSDQVIIQKLVLFTATGRTNLYNLALVDEFSDGELSDTVVSNNDDMRTVLTTVFRIIEDFLNRFPTFIVLFQGSDERRNRLYRMALGRELKQLTTLYEVRGFINGSFVPFERNQPYESFLIRKRLWNQNLKKQK